MSVMAKKVDKVEQNKVEQSVKETQIINGNTDILTVQLLDSINRNLVSLIGYLKAKDLK